MGGEVPAAAPTTVGAIANAAAAASVGPHGVLGWLRGAATELLNGLTTVLPLPVIQGDLFVPQGDAAAGAAAVDGLLAAIGLRRANAGIDAIRAAGTLRPTRESRTLLATAATDLAGGDVTCCLEFDADAPDADWGVTGRESTAVAVYVDGAWHSDVLVLHERTGGYRINLGALPAGHHQVEIRAAGELGASGAGPARVTRASIGVESGEQALFDRYAPLLQQRDLGLPSARLDAAQSDTPMLLAPSLVDNHDGTRTITYYVMFSNEDGGTGMPKLVRETGRAVDYEPLCSVTVDAAGRRVTPPRFQGPAHQRYTFDGEFDGDRPVLRIATSNNNFSTRLQAGGSLWSQSVTMPTLQQLAPDGQPSNFTPLNNDPTWLTDASLLRANPWTYAVMGKEMLREGRAVSEAADGAANCDMRRLLFVARGSSQLHAALDAGRPVHLRLRDGRAVDVQRAADATHEALNTAVELPAGISGADVVAIEGVAGDAWVLGADFLPRTLPSHAG